MDKTGTNQKDQLPRFREPLGAEENEAGPVGARGREVAGRGAEGMSVGREDLSGVNFEMDDSPSLIDNILKTSDPQSGWSGRG